jgi:Holliday junction resolvase-like predicted endonuclease
MSEYLLLSVYTKFLEDQGYKVERRVKIPGGSGLVDIIARKGKQTLLVEARKIANEGDVFEALARSKLNQDAMPNSEAVIVLEKEAIDEELEARVLEACYENKILIHYIDINDRQVFEDILTFHIFPAFREMMKQARAIMKGKPSSSAKQVLTDLVKSLKDIRGPPSLADDIKSLMKEVKAK